MSCRGTTTTLEKPEFVQKAEEQLEAEQID